MLRSDSKELEGLFERIYEDNLSGKLTDERFAKMSARYESEQAENEKELKLLNRELFALKTRAEQRKPFLPLSSAILA